MERIRILWKSVTHMRGSGGMASDDAYKVIDIVKSFAVAAAFGLAFLLIVYLGAR